MGYGLDPKDPKDLLTGWQTAESPLERTWYKDKIKEKTGVSPKKLRKIIREIERRE